ncbi:endolytic transglycosylase MltG [Devosia sp. RR2S18]|uniref:endolytic transglycosylase MltG n=1 Tax=Devosia rhizosphaerae TaxID=3049774 RepID=UPI00253FC12E|nr:endolytic transglycosylase MltG [Devosia sp. RR2S18]WIJ24186.1 endolytic transglycosylase MltG [Devosia sp. RR2S18]
MIERKGRRQRRRSSNGFVDVVNGALTLLVIGLVVVGGILFYTASQYYGDGPLIEETTFRVEAGNTLTSASQRLEEQGIITNAFIFRQLAQRLEDNTNIKAGEFRIPAGASMADILRELTEGNPIRYAVTIPEGWTAWQVVQRINDNTDLTGEITVMPAEGSILPGSYDYTPGDTRQSVLDSMQAAMTTTLAEVWDSRQPDLPLGSPEEMLTLASIVERETGLGSERPQVAAVFVNRLREGMRLQSDPTIIYGITMGQQTLDRGLRRSEIDAMTPYNTYQIDGLPPTPIANPGIDSLRAVASPDEHDYLYFVAKGATPSEGHVFAETYAEHQQNVARYREIEAEAAARAEEAEAARQLSQEDDPGEVEPVAPAQ